MTNERMEPNELVKQLIEENLRTQAPYLDLAYCGLQGDEPALEMLSEYTHLKGLNMCDMPDEDIENRWVLSGGISNRKLMYGGVFSNINIIPDYLPTSLEYLCIGGTHDGSSYIKGIDNIAKFTNLKQLYLNYNEINDLTPLKCLPQLEHLHLHQNYLEDLTPLAHLKKLKRLDISMNTDVKSLSPLRELTKLRQMNASACAVSDLTLLRGLTQLEILEIADNNQDMGSLSGVSSLTNLRKLFVGGNKLERLDALNKLHKLEILELYNTELETFNLDTLPALKELKLGECDLDVLPLPYLPELKRLDVSDNRLTEFSPEMLARLPKLDELNLWGNPIENLPKEIYNQANCLHQVKAFFNQNN